mmetsp:Transcript_30603/g.107571  ORF Transcript_30603/g.107571 Transcript_30603/m.107571 type:complete len:213 (-) Transcript_30603:39-677(-)
MHRRCRRNGLLPGGLGDAARPEDEAPPRRGNDGGRRRHRRHGYAIRCSPAAEASEVAAVADVEPRGVASARAAAPAARVVDHERATSRVLCVALARGARRQACGAVRGRARGPVRTAEADGRVARGAAGTGRGRDGLVGPARHEDVALTRRVRRGLDGPPRRRRQERDVAGRRPRRKVVRDRDGQRRRRRGRRRAVRAVDAQSRLHDQHPAR